MTTKTPSALAGFETTIDQSTQATVTFRKTDGSATTITFPAASSADVLLGLEMQIAQAIAGFVAKFPGTDRRLLMPVRKRKVTKIQGGAAKGEPILSLELDGRIPLDMVLLPEQIQGLIEYLQELQTLEGKAPPKPN